MMNTAPNRMWTAAAAMLIAGALAADEIKFDDITYGGKASGGLPLKLIGMRDGLLYFQVGQSEKSVALEQIQSIKVDKYPELADADAALTANDLPKAEKLLRAVLAKASEDYIKIIVGSKLVYVLDWSNRFGEALKEWTSLYKLDNGSFVTSTAPRNFPKDEAGKKAALDAVAAAMRGVGDQGLLDQLKEISAAIKDEAPADAPPAPDAPEKMPAPAPGAAPPAGTPAAPVPGAPPPPASGKALSQRDVVGELIAAQKWDQAQAAIEKEMKLDGATLSTLFYQKGLVERAKGQDMEAALSFMRAAIHFPRSEVAAPSLVETAKIMAKMGRKKQAADLLQDARGRVALSNKAMIAEIDQLLGTLK
jgi:tetratricopeptide (TPR) repeat protein